jgi:hypothetical protein
VSTFTLMADTPRSGSPTHSRQPITGFAARGFFNRGARADFFGGVGGIMA